MSRSVLAIGLSLAAVLAAAAIVVVSNEPTPVSANAPSIDAGDFFDPSASTEARILALEQAVAEERNARQLLEEELQILYAEIDQLAAASAGRGTGEVSDEAIVTEARVSRGRIEARRQELLSNANERRIAELIEAGFSPDRAEWLVRRESELQMETMTAAFEARAAGEPVDGRSLLQDAQGSLRAEIGDTEYEQYLQATGRSTTVEITSILESSPAQQAGLQPGDQIVSYNGTRVFDIGELNRYTMQGEPGGSVVVDIVRDGVPMQVVMPSGPIGVMIAPMRPRGRR